MDPAALHLAAAPAVATPSSSSLSFSSCRPPPPAPAGHAWPAVLRLCLGIPPRSRPHQRRPPRWGPRPRRLDDVGARHRHASGDRRPVFPYASGYRLLRLCPTPPIPPPNSTPPSCRRMLLPRAPPEGTRWKKVGGRGGAGWSHENVAPSPLRKPRGAPAPVPHPEPVQ
jgi:hypothetical protein